MLMGACSVSKIAGGVRIDTLPTNLEKPCPHPLDIYLSVSGDTVGADEIRMGRLGDALINCGNEKELVVDTYNKVRNIFKESQ